MVAVPENVFALVRMVVPPTPAASMPPLPEMMPWNERELVLESVRSAPEAMTMFPPAPLLPEIPPTVSLLLTSSVAPEETVMMLCGEKALLNPIWSASVPTLTFVVPE